MKIEIVPATQQVRVFEIEYGGCFSFEGILYMRIHEIAGNPDVTAVIIGTGSTSRFEGPTKVTPREAKIVLTDLK